MPPEQAPLPSMPVTPAFFPDSTAWSSVLEARDRNAPGWRAHLERLVARYWKPVRWYLMTYWKCSPEDAEDLAQEFFTRFYEKDILSKASPERGSFRKFLKLQLRDVAVMEFRKRSALKRGGDTRAVAIDAPEAGPAGGESPEAAFDRAWAETALSAALGELRKRLEAEGKGPVFDAFWDCVVATPPLSYKESADRLGISVNDVGHHVFRARGELRGIMTSLVRESVERDEDVQDELDCLFAALRR